MSKTGYLIAHRLTQDQLNAGDGNNLFGGLIEIIDEFGIPTGFLYIANGHGDLPTLITAGGGGIPEAPIDGKTYGRNDAGWTETAGWTLNKKILITSHIPIETVIHVNSSGANYTVSGDTISLGLSANSFNSNKSMLITLNGIIQDKGTDVVWLSATSFKFELELGLADVINILA